MTVLAGVGGVLLAYQRQALSVQSYQVFVALSVVALTYLAGITSISGVAPRGTGKRGQCVGADRIVPVDHAVCH